MNGLGRADCRIDPSRLREQAARAGFGELPIRAPHVLGVLRSRRLLRSDPFDRILPAQSRVEELILLTNDRKPLECGSPP